MDRYGLLGKNISYSFSKGHFTEKFNAESLNAIYENFDIPSIAEFSEVLKEKNLKGLNVTIPYKLDVIPFMDTLDASAKNIGAVNVIKLQENGKLIGYNSDYFGFKNSLEPLLKPSTKKALILGTGGASKAVAYALKTLNIAYTFVSRTPDTDQNRIAYGDLNKELLASHHLIINCSPLGTHPNVDQCPDIPYEYLTENHILYDLIYNPAETLFLKKGVERGSTTCNGLQMLILQAEKSWEIWKAKDAF